MKVNFKYPRGIDGKMYQPGIHEVEDSLSDHWFFKGILANKDVQILEHPVVVKQPQAPAVEEEDEASSVGHVEQEDEDELESFGDKLSKRFKKKGK